MEMTGPRDPASPGGEATVIVGRQRKDQRKWWFEINLSQQTKQKSAL
jgi:hypothetical protein